MAHQVEQFDTLTEADQIIDRLRNFRGPDAERDKRAATFAAVDRSTLAPELAKQIDHWLITYDRLNAARERVRDGDLSTMETLVMLAEELGISTERLWWRYGQVEGLKKSAEELGLSGQRQVVEAIKGNAMKSAKSFAAVHGHAAQEYANQLHRTSPTLSWAALRPYVAKRFGVSAETVKKSLINPKKAG